jgi:steroid delta-isomerase-like uncharacterized protein
MVGCQDKEAMAELEAMRVEAKVWGQNEALVMRFYEAWNSGEIEAISEIVSPDYVWHQASGQDVSLEQMIELLKSQMVAFPDRNFNVEDIFAKGGKVALRYIHKGTHEGDVEGFPATGNKFEITGIEIYRVEDGKIVETWEANDSLGFYQQLGFELVPKEEK